MDIDDCIMLVVNLLFPLFLSSVFVIVIYDVSNIVVSIQNYVLLWGFLSVLFMFIIGWMYYFVLYRWGVN